MKARRLVSGLLVGAAVAAVGLAAAAVPRSASPSRDAAESAPPAAAPLVGDAAISPAPAPTLTGAPATHPGALVIWARGGLAPAFAMEVAALPWVTAAAHVRSTTLGLVGSRNADGTPVDVLADGFRIPVSVGAVDPAEYARTLTDGDDLAAVQALQPGSVLLSQTGARLRGIGVGAAVDLAGLAGLSVVGVVADGVVGRSEIVLHIADADAAGIDEDGTVYLLHDAAPGDETDDLVAAVEGLVPDDVTARVVDVTSGQPRQRAPLVLSLAQRKDLFGEFAFQPRPGVREITIEPSFPDRHIVTVHVPILGAVTCHRGIVDDLVAALSDVQAAGLAGQIDPDRYAGCYYPRRINTGGDRLSSHSWGIALDINVDLSLPNLGPAPHPEVIAAFEAHGFRWGGDFIQPDYHHFEWVGTGLEPSRRLRR